MMQETPKYSFKVFWSDPDNAFIAICPEFPGLSAFGDTEEDALREAKIALQMFIEDIEESGETLPVRQSAHSYSGKLQLRLAKSLHRQAAELADSEGISLNRLIEDALRDKVTGRQVGKRVIEEMRKESAQTRLAIASVAMTGQQPTARHTKTVRTTTEISTEQTVSMSALSVDRKGN